MGLKSSEISSKSSSKILGSTDLTEKECERICARRSDILSVENIGRLPTNIADTLRAESIASLAVAPLATGSGPLGLLAIGSRKPDAFGQEDLDLLTQISIRISLALDNALAYGRVNASAVRLRNGWALVPGSRVIVLLSRGILLKSERLCGRTSWSTSVNLFLDLA
jgi:GAF domain-containing protein